MASARVALSPSAPPSLHQQVIAEQQEPKPEAKFTAKFLNRRMRAHRKLQSAIAREWSAAIFDEAANALEVSR